MNDNVDKIHIFTRLILLFNIIFVVVLLIFFVLFSREVESLHVPNYLLLTLKKVNFFVFVIGIILVILNAFLLINHLLFNIKKYFRLSSKLDFNDISGAMGILNSLPSIDEYGHLGKSVTKLLRVYLNYAALMKKRLANQDKVMKVMFEESKMPVLIFERQSDSTYILSFISKVGVSVLELENSSAIIGRPMINLLDKETCTKLQHITSHNPREASQITITLNDTIGWFRPIQDKSSSKEEQPILHVNAGVMPLFFQFPDDVRYEEMKKHASNTNTIVDSIFLILKPHEVFDDAGLDENELYDDIPDPTFEDLHIDDHLK